MQVFKRKTRRSARALMQATGLHQGPDGLNPNEDLHLPPLVAFPFLTFGSFGAAHPPLRLFSPRRQPSIIVNHTAFKLLLYRPAADRSCQGPRVFVYRSCLLLRLYSIVLSPFVTFSSKTILGPHSLVIICKNLPVCQDSHSSSSFTSSVAIISLWNEMVFLLNGSRTAHIWLDIARL